MITRIRTLSDTKRDGQSAARHIAVVVALLVIGSAAEAQVYPPPPQSPAASDGVDSPGWVRVPGPKSGGTGGIVDVPGYSACRYVTVGSTQPGGEAILLANSSSWTAWRTNPGAGDGQLICCRPGQIMLCQGAAGGPQVATISGTGPNGYGLLNGGGAASAQCTDAWGLPYWESAQFSCGQTGAGVNADGQWVQVGNDSYTCEPNAKTDLGACQAPGGCGTGIQSVVVWDSCGNVQESYSQTCDTGVSCGCTLPWGGTINNGQSVTAYATSSVPYGGTCPSQTQTCTNGSLSGSYQYGSCIVQPGADCTLPWGGSIASGQSTASYPAASVPYGSTCQADTDTCTNGSLSNGDQFGSCSAQAAAGCTLPWGGSIASGQSVTSYPAASVPYGSTCQADTDTCTNGSLSSGDQYASCAVAACVPNWRDSGTCSCQSEGCGATKTQSDGCGNTRTVNCSPVNVGHAECTDENVYEAPDPFGCLGYCGCGDAACAPITWANITGYAFVNLVPYGGSYGCNFPPGSPGYEVDTPVDPTNGCNIDGTLVDCWQYQ